MRNLDDLPFGVAEQQQVGFGIEQNRAAYFFGPVIEVGDTTQTGLDAADHDWHVGISLAGTLRINDDRAIRALATLAVRRVGIVATHAAIAGVAIHHRVHVAGGDTEEKIRFTEHLEGVGTLPIGLRDDTHAKTLRLEQATDDRHAETRMIDVGITRYDDDIAAIPTERIHLGTRHGEKRRHAEA